jgi:predicted nuclease of predicted toxin-antitoxin system
MKFLLDANLSWRLVNVLKPYCDEVLHVGAVNLPKPAKDAEIWDFAKQNNAVIITNDDDFYKFSITKGFPPKVVVLRTGNQSNNYLADILIKHLQDIQNLDNSEYGLLEIIG